MVAPLAQAQFASLPQPLRQAAQEFEATFLAQMLQPMFQGLETDGPFGGGQSESVFRGFLIDEIARAMARAGGVGVAPAIGAELLKLQEGGG
jgi:peptidoglycan hydrolase FlgJ